MGGAVRALILSLVLVSVMGLPATTAQPVCVYRYYYHGICSDDDFAGAVADELYQALRTVDARADVTLEEMGDVAAGMKLLNPLTDLWYMGDEPNTWNGGTTSSGAPYLADENGISDAREGLDPYAVLNGKYGVDCRPVAIWCSVEMAHRMGLVGDYIYPGEATFIALYGSWSDYNGDGWVQSFTADAHIVRGDDIEPVYRDVHREITAENEWAGFDARSLVGYVSPGDWSRDGIPRYGDGQPDLFFQSLGNGVYYATGQLFPSTVTATGSLVGDVALEVFEGIPTPDGTRDYAPRPDRPMDVDILDQLDATLSAVAESVAGGAIDAADGAANDALDVLPAGTDAASFHRYGAPVFEPTVVRSPAEQGGYDHTDEWHGYLDVDLRLAIAGDAGLASFALSGDAAQNHGADGRRTTGPGEYGVAGHLGLWRDDNYDGWIGRPRASPDCPDVYDCGQTPDPNEYDDAREFLGVCPGEFHVYVAPESGQWTVPVYRVGRTDAMASDLSDDGDADRAAFSGPVALLVKCDPWSGRLWSPEHLLVPSGTLDQRIRVTSDVVYIDFSLAGVPTTDAVYDEDVLS